MMKNFSNPEKSESLKEGKIIKFPERRKPELVAAEKREEILNEPLALANKILDLEEELVIMEGAVTEKPEKPEKIKKKKQKPKEDASTPVTEEELDKVRLLRGEMEEEIRKLREEYKLIVSALSADEKAELEKLTADLESSRRSLGHLLPEKESGGKEWKDGELVWEEATGGDFSDTYWSHPDGVLLAHGEKLLLNGVLLYERPKEFVRFNRGNIGKFIKENIAPPGDVIVQEGNKLFLNGKTVIYEGEFDNWVPHPQGVIIQRGDEYLLNGRLLLYKGSCNGWGKHPRGVLVRIGDKFLLDGQELLYEGKFDRWWPHPRGFVIKRDNQLLLNGKELIFEGAYNKFNECTRGFVIEEQDGWLNLDGKRFLNLQKVAKRSKNWIAHENGVLVQDERETGDREWRFYSFDREVKQDE